MQKKNKLGLMGILCVVLLGPVIGYFIAFYTVPPNCDVIIELDDYGRRVLRVEPNFVVNSVYGVTQRISHDSEVKLQKLPGSAPMFIISESAQSGETINVVCRLQYDRLVASISDVHKKVSVP